MMKKNASKMVIKSNLNNINAVMQWIKSELKPLFEAQKKFDNLKLCIQEALTNAIVHGNCSDEEKSVTISYDIGEKLQVSIVDEGEGVDKEKQTEDVNNIKDEDLFEESGRGIMLIKHFCDDVIFAKEGITLIIGYK